MKRIPFGYVEACLCCVALCFSFREVSGAENEPVIVVNGQASIGSEVKALDLARVTMTGGFSSGVIFYTTNGVAPDFNATRYTGEFTFNTDRTIRAISYTEELDQSAEREPLLVRVAPTFTLAVNGSGGVVTINPQQARYEAGTLVEVSVSDPEGQLFSHWNGSVTSSSRTVAIRMNRNHNISAVFEILDYEPEIEVLGKGRVLQLPRKPLSPSDFISCDVGMLVGIPDEGYYFARWDPAPDPYRWQYAATASPSVAYALGDGQLSASTAIFAPLPEGQHSLTVLVEGKPGMVFLDPPRNYFTNGESVKLRAEGAVIRCDSGGKTYAFMGWSGETNSGESEIQLVMDGNKTITAHFAEKIRWIMNGGGTSPGIAPDGRVHVSDGGGYNYKIINSSGEILAGNSAGVSPISLDEEMNFYINGENFVRAFSYNNIERWKAPRSYMIPHDAEWAPVAIGNDLVFADVMYSDDGSGILAISRSGEVAWRLPNHSGVMLDSEDRIYARHGSAIARIGLDGGVIWERAGSGFRAIGGNDLLYVVGGTNLVVYNSEGEIVRAQELPGMAEGDPVIDAEETIYIPLKEGIVAIRADESIKWMGDVRLRSLLLAEDGTLFGIADRKHLRALDSGSGEARWELNVVDLTGYPTAGEARMPSLGHDGTLYVGVTAGGFFADFLIAVDVGTVLADAPWPKYLGNARNTSKMEWPGKLRLSTRVEGNEVRVGVMNNAREAEVHVSSDLVNWTSATNVVAGAEASFDLDTGVKFFRAVRKPW